MVRSFEWPTYLLILVTYAIFALGIASASMSMSLAIALMAIAGVFHSSLSHEVLHGHPTKNDFLNAALVTPALGLFVPYLRFRDTHIAHHKDENLTDPYDDPETNFCDPVVWLQLPAWRKRIHLWNNTLLGRIFLGPFISQILFMKGDLVEILNGNQRIALSWAIHIASVRITLWVVFSVSDVTFWAYALASYFAMGILKIRTYLEHRAHLNAKGRTVIIEDRGFLSLCFLNNNFHAVHHKHPKVAWYALPALYESDKAQYLSENESYHYPSYKDIFSKYFLKAKDPVPHPLWPKEEK